MNDERRKKKYCKKKKIPSIKWHKFVKTYAKNYKKSTIIPNMLKKKKKNIETKNVEQKLSKNKMRKKKKLNVKYDILSWLCFHQLVVTKTRIELLQKRKKLWKEKPQVNFCTRLE